MSKLRTIPLIALGLLVVLGAAFYFLWYSPTAADITALGVEIDTAGQEEAQLRTELVRLQELSELEAAIAALDGELRRLLPFDEDPDDLPLLFQEVARLNGNTITEVSLGEPSVIGEDDPAQELLTDQIDGRALATVPYTLIVVGTFDQAVGYLQTLHTQVLDTPETAIAGGPRPVIVESVGVLDDSGGQLQLILTGRALYALPLVESTEPEPEPTDEATTEEDE